MKIKIEALKKEDASDLFEFETRNRMFFETMVPTRGDAYYQFNQFLTVLDELIKEQLEEKSLFYLIKDESDNIVGRINLIDIANENRVGNIGYRIGEGFLKKGIATNALKLMLVEAMKHKINEIYAMTTIDNLGSQKVLENNGFYRNIKNDDSDFVHYVWKS